MIHHIQRRGDDLVLVIDPGLARELQLQEDTPVLVTNVDGALVLKRSDAAVPADFEAALQECNERYPKALKRLAE